MIQFDEHFFRWAVQVETTKNKGTPKWMVKIVENPIKNGWFGVRPPIFGNIHLARLSMEVIVKNDSHPIKERKADELGKIFDHLPGMESHRSFGIKNG